jgi:chromosome segregation ATPase
VKKRFQFLPFELNLHRYKTVKAELAAIQKSMDLESAEARAAEEALAGAMADAQRLRDEMDSLRGEQSATAAALMDARSVGLALFTHVILCS